ncbi:hypothetical protein V6Z12_A09G128100 [Gossypium hirsutum]
MLSIFLTLALLFSRKVIAQALHSRPAKVLLR